MNQTIIKYLTTLLFTAGLFWILPQNTEAQLLEINQTVYGMDCAPCAYALENRTKALKGVESASVSLNDGLLTVKLAEDNSLSLKQIRKAVEESGFSAQNSKIRLAGTLTKENGQYVLVIPAGEKYLLNSGRGTFEARSRDHQTGDTITLAGLISQEELPETEYWTLDVGK